MEAVEYKYGFDKNNDDITNYVSGYFAACQALGEAIGPIEGSIFNTAYGFRVSCDILFFTTISMLALYYFFCRNGVDEKY